MSSAIAGTPAARGSAAARAAARARGRCTNAQCPERAHKGQLAAALFSTIRELERVRAAEGVRAAARGVAAPLNGARVVEEVATESATRENQHILQERLNAIRALVKERNETGGLGNDDPIVVALEEFLHMKQTQAQHLEGDAFDAAIVQCAAVESDLKLKKKDLDPLTCGICMDKFSSDVAGMPITGKFCYHYFHPTCLAMQAMQQVKPSCPQDAEGNRYWQHDGMTGGLNTYSLRPEVSTRNADGDLVPSEFPANVWVACGVCRNENYANKGYYDQATTALQTLDQSQAATDVSGPDWVQKARNHHTFVLLAVPGDNPDNLVMLVPAKEPNKSDLYPLFKNSPINSNHVKACGFVWDSGDRANGHGAFVRPRRPDDVLDASNKFNGSLGTTSTGRNWKFNYGPGTWATPAVDPDAPAAEAPAAAASSSTD